jgi:hypothetical protein
MDYANGKIYTIRSFQTDKFYIGSTTSTLTKRLSAHKAGYKKGRPCASSEIIKYGDAYIELLEDFPCFKRDQLCKREGQLIREHKDNCVNKCIAGRTIKEYYYDNKEHISEQMNQYYNKNREKRLEQMKQYQREYYKRKKEEKIQL